MRILQIYWISDIGGVGSYTADMIGALEARGHHNSRLLLSPPSAISPTSPGCHYMMHLREGAKTDADLLARLLPVIRAERPDVVYYHSALPTEIVAPILREFPSVAFAHNYGFFCPSGTLYHVRTGKVCGLRAPSLRCVPHAIIDRCNSRRPGRILASMRQTGWLQTWGHRVGQIVVGSRYVKERCVEARFDADRINVLPYPITWPESYPPSPDMLPVDVLFVGRVTREKGLIELLDACAQLKRPITLAVVGVGHALPEVQRVAGELGLAGRVTFTGALDRAQIQGWYRAARVIAFPSVWPEPFGMVGPEAMSHSKPVVAFDVGGVPEWLEHEVTGLLAPPGNVSQFAAHLERLLDDDALRRRMGDAGHEKAHRLYSMERHIDGLLAVFQAAIERHDGTAAPAAWHALDLSR